MRIHGMLFWCAVVAVLSGYSCDSGNAEDLPPAGGGTASSETMCRCAGGANSATAKIAQILSEPLKSTGLDFTEEPLENVVNFLQDEYNIPIQIDEPALEGVGNTRDEPISVQVTNVSLRSALRLLLKTKGLTYYIGNEILIVTTPEGADKNLVTCVYDVRDLVTVPPQGSRGRGQQSATPDFDSLIDAITTCVQTETWAENGGGEADIRPLPTGLLVISQTQEVHEQIAELLSAIRATLRQLIHPSAGEAMSGMGGRGGYGGRGGMEGGYGGGRGGEMGMEPTPAEEAPFD